MTYVYINMISSYCLYLRVLETQFGHLLSICKLHKGSLHLHLHLHIGKGSFPNFLSAAFDQCDHIPLYMGNIFFLVLKGHVLLIHSGSQETHTWT